MQRMICGVLVLALAAVVATGCNRGPTLGEEYVEGVVTLDGQPVAGATVMFVPVTPGVGMSARGTTDEQGVYRLTAVGSGEQEAQPGAGTLPGEYYVGVSTMSFEGLASITPEEAEEAGLGEIPQTPSVQVPQRYNRPQGSGIRATVESGKNTIDIELSAN